MCLIVSCTPSPYTTVILVSGIHLSHIAVRHPSPRSQLSFEFISSVHLVSLFSSFFILPLITTFAHGCPCTQLPLPYGRSIVPGGCLEVVIISLSFFYRLHSHLHSVHSTCIPSLASSFGNNVYLVLPYYYMYHFLPRRTDIVLKHAQV